MKSNKINKNEKGVILVMAMMILALMMTSVLALSKIIRGEINMTRNIDNSIIAFYVAESGIEKSLYYIKYSAENNDFSFFTNLNQVVYSFSDDNERKIKITEATIEADYWEKYNIERGSPVHVDIIDPTGRVDAISGMTNYKIEWNIENCADNSDNRLEFTKESFAYAFNNADTSKTPITCACGEGSDSWLDYEGTIAANRYYRFSFEPLDEELVSYLKFTAWRDDDEGIKSEVSIKIEGSYRNSVQHLQARLPALGRISDVFSYVIFSGGDLTKNITCDDVVCGCTDEDADYGYNSDAVMDDGSCIYYGCSDLDSYNYNSKADSCSGADNDNSCCTYLVMYMATDNNGNTFLSDGDSLGVWPYGPSQTCSENKGESCSELEIVDSKLRAFIGASGTGFRGEEEGFYFPENEDYNKSGAKIYWYNFTDSTTELLADNWSDMFYGGDIIKSQLEGTGINEDSWVGSLGGDIGASSF